MASERAIAIQTERKHQEIMRLVGALAQSYNLHTCLERLRLFNPNRLPGPQRMLQEQEIMIDILKQIAVTADHESSSEFTDVQSLPPSRRRRVVLTEDT